MQYARHPKTDIAQTVVSPINMIAISRSATLRIVAPGTAAYWRTIFITKFCRPSNAISWCIFIIRMPNVGAPLPNITMSIVQTKSIRWKNTYRSSLLPILSFSFRCISISSIIVGKVASNGQTKIKRRK